MLDQGRPARAARWSLAQSRHLSALRRSRVGETYHVDAVVAGVERKQVAPDQVSLLVEPVSVENKPLLLHLLHRFLSSLN